MKNTIFFLSLWKSTDHNILTRVTIKFFANKKKKLFVTIKIFTILQLSYIQYFVAKKIATISHSYMRAFLFVK